MQSLKPRGNQRASLMQDFTENFGGHMLRRKSQIRLRAARADAELAYRSRGEFLANMNHELRTPLNAIIGFTTMIRDGKSFGITVKQVEDYTSYILQSADLLLVHINTILEYAAVESGGAKLLRRPSKPYDIISSAADQMQVMAEAANVKLVVNCDEDLPDVMTDPDAIEKALRHLIENAIIHSPDESRITLHAKLGVKTGKTDRVYFAVEDHGEGMTPDELQRAMHSFEQVHQGLHRKFEGTGIGLPIAKSFIELNGGDFSIKTAKSKGTIIRFTLPVAAQEAVNIPQPLKAAG